MKDTKVLLYNGPVRAIAYLNLSSDPKETLYDIVSFYEGPGNHTEESRAFLKNLRAGATVKAPVNTKIETL